MTGTNRAWKPQTMKQAAKAIRLARIAAAARALQYAAEESRQVVKAMRGSDDG